MNTSTSAFAQLTPHTIRSGIFPRNPIPMKIKISIKPYTVEDVERGAVKFWFQTNGRTDGRTDAINIFWAFLL